MSSILLMKVCKGKWLSAADVWELQNPVWGGRENHTGAYELVDETLSEGQRYDDNYLVFNGITLADDEYVSLHFNDTVYYAGAAHPLSYYIPVTISVATGEEALRKKFWGRPGTRSGQQALLKKKTKKILMPITAFTSQRRNCAISIARISL